MKKVLLLFGFLLVAGLMLTACSNDKAQSDVSTSSSEVVEEKTTPADNSITGAVIAIPVEDVPLANIRVQELKTLGESVTAYKYNFKSVFHNSNNGLLIEEISYVVSVNGNNIQKSYPSSVKFDKDFSYFDVYLDLNKKIAYGTCPKPTITCTSEHRKKAYLINYYSEQLDVTPVELISELDNKAKATGEMNYNDRKVTLIDSSRLEGNYQRLYVDNFYGLPLKQVIFIYNSDGEEVVLKERYFELIAAGPGSVKLSDVTLPREYTIVN